MNLRMKKNRYQPKKGNSVVGLRPIDIGPRQSNICLQFSSCKKVGEDAKPWTWFYKKMLARLSNFPLWSIADASAPPPIKFFHGI